MPTVILRHRKENLKKCSLRGLESEENFHFLRYPTQVLPDLQHYLLLTMGAPVLSREDAHLGIFLIDATWRYASQMENNISLPESLAHRSLPTHYQTAYPRYQTGCPVPEQGLASIEALYLAFHLTGRPVEGLLDRYHWKEEFLRKNGLI